MKKTLFLLLTLIAPIWAIGQSFSGSGTGTSNDPYLIFNPLQLDQMRNFLDQSGVYFKLMANIDLDEYIAENNPTYGWQPVGTSGERFKGVLDGNNKTISNIWFSRSSMDYVGFFGCTSGATIKNLTMQYKSGKQCAGKSYTGLLIGSDNGSAITNIIATYSNQYVGTSYVGGLIGEASSSRINNCSITVSQISGSSTYVGGFVGKAHKVTMSNNNVTTQVQLTSRSLVGGFVAYADSSSFTKCSCAALSPTSLLVSGGATTGGFAGKVLSSTFTSCSTIGGIATPNALSAVHSVGGFIGYSINSTLQRCSAFGTVTVEGGNAEVRVGGLIGCAENPEITYCGTHGDIAVGEYNWSTSASGVGGLVGKILCSTKPFSIQSSYAINNINAANNVGGLVGYITFNQNRYNNVLSDNYHSGNIAGGYDVGGLIGFGEKISNISILRNYNQGDVSGNDYVAGLCGKLTGRPPVAYKTFLYSNVALSERISSAENNIGRVYASIGDTTIVVGGSGTSNRNYALVTCQVSVNGTPQNITDNLQNGDSRGASTLKYAASYQGLGWSIGGSSHWTILETESYPYNTEQTAPPVIQSILSSGATIISGKATSGATVYVVIGDTVRQTTASNNQWSVTIPALQAGERVYAYAKAAELDYSYRTYGTVSYAGSGTEDDPYQIYTASDLANINSASYYKLMNDIDLSSYVTSKSPSEGWTPVGRTTATPIGFDGDGHTISGLWTNTTEDYTGLFATLSDATVKNLTIKTATTKKVIGGNYTGILVGKTTSCSFENINVEGAVQSASGNYVGGMAGIIWGGGSSSRISASVNVSGQDYVGGITGQNYGNDIDQSFATGSVTGKDYVGGLFGHVNCGVTNNYFDGNVTASEGYAGGISGLALSYISTCKSSGSIISNGTGANSIAGGIVGYTTANISNCYSTANTTAYQYAAGITGYSTAAVNKCYSSGNITASNVAAGVVGYNDGSNATTHNCVALNPTLSVSLTTGYGMRVLGGYKNEAPTPTTDNFALKSMALSVNGISQQIYDDLLNGTSYVADNFKVASFYTNLGWNFSTVWGIDEGTGYPYLQWERTATHNVIYKVDGEVYQTQSYEEGAAITPLEAPTRDGYTFSGWSEIPATMGTEDIIVTGTFSQNPQYTLGDINNDGELNVGDLSRLVSMILNDYSTPGATFSAADINADGELNVGDYSRLVQMILNAPVAGSKAFLGSVRSNSYRPAAVFMHSDDIALSAGQTKLVAVGMTNYDNTFNAIQFDLQLPAGLEIDVEATETAARTSGFDIATNGNRVILSNTRNATITGGEGDIVYLAVKAADNIKLGSYELAFDNVLLSTTDNEVVKAGGFYSTVMAEDPTAISSATSISNSQPSYIFDLQGRKVTGKLQKGIYVIDGKKVNVR